MNLQSFKVVLLGVAVALSGCMTQSKYMTKTSGAAATPSPSNAVVVFLRPSSFGGTIQASVYDTGAQEDKFVGIVSAGDKLAYAAEPGDHLFMVIAENADFMIAHLDAGKTYYALIKPRVGVWKARFSLIPIHNDAGAQYSTRSEDFSKWMSATSWVSVTPQAEQWYTEHAADIRAKKLDNMKKWDKASEQQKEELTLKADDEQYPSTA